MIVAIIAVWIMTLLSVMCGILLGVYLREKKSPIQLVKEIQHAAQEITRRPAIVEQLSIEEEEIEKDPKRKEGLEEVSKAFKSLLGFDPKDV